MQTFFKLELGDNLIQNIAENAKTLSVFNEEICTILKEKQEQGTDVNGLIKAITGDIPEKLGDKIDALTSLVSLTPDEIKVFENQGVDINAKIELLEKAVNAKTPTISTTQEGRRRFLKGLANNTQADAAIQNADFEQFGKQGIPLKYSREEFMHNMNALIAEYNNAAAAVQSDFKVPELKLTDEEINTETKAKIEELKQKNQSQNVEVIFEDGTHQATRFLGTQGGSNEAYFTQIGDKLYYIKYPKQANLGQSIEEVLAADLYRAAGIESPNMKLIYNNNGDVIGMASEYVPGMKMPEDKTVLYDSYAVDAWLANWDAPKNDNTQVFRNGTVIKSDVGGSLNYRARGGVKTNFGSTVDELVTLLEQNSTYSSMTKEELLKSIEHVTSIPDAAIRKMVMDSPIENTSIANTLIDRKKYLSLFSEKLKTLDESQFENIYEMLLEAKKLTNDEFEKTVDIGELFGYTQTKTGFEGLLNTRDITELNLTTEQRRIAERMQEEIRKFTLENSVADGVNLSHETKEFLNSVLKGVPEFAAYFSKPQHDTQKYSLDIHILKVLQDSMNDPMYKELGDKDKVVLKFSTLLHDIGKRYLGSSSDTGHAVKSAEYVYSILDRFNLDADVKDRIIQTVNNHHWFKEYNTGVINEEMVATYCRRPEDFKIFQIMAKADLKNVDDGFYQSTLEAKSVEEADKIFAEKMKAIQVKVDELQSKKVAITASRFREVPERVTSDGRVLEARQIPRVTKVFNGEDTEFKVLNMTELSPDTDMYQYGFNHITLEDLKFLVHMPGDYGIRNFNIFKTLGQNPMNNSVQSISMISMADKATYCSRQFGLILDVDNSNVGHAYYANTASGTSKGLVSFKEELFENSRYRSFVKDQFKEWVLTNKGVELSDEKYGQIMKYITGLKYPETQIKDGVIDGFSKEELLGAFTFSRNQLNEMKKEKTHGSHNEIVGLQPKIRGVVAKVASLDECPDYVLQFAKENDLPIFLVGN